MRPKNIHYGAKPKYPLATMSVGQSFVVSNAPRWFDRYARARGYELDKRFSVKKTADVVTVTRLS